MTAKKKNPDYTESAVDLKNDQRVLVDLRAYHGLQDQIEKLNSDIDALIPQELKDQLASLEIQKKACLEGIKSDVESYGSYQDVESGWYAIKQRKKSVTFPLDKVRAYAPKKVADFVIVESVDEKAMEAMIKAKQLTATELELCSETSESFVYIVR